MVKCKHSKMPKEELMKYSIQNRLINTMKIGLLNTLRKLRTIMVTFGVSNI